MSAEKSGFPELYGACKLNTKHYSTLSLADGSIGLVTGSLSQKAGGLFYSARVPANRMAKLGRSPMVYGIYDDEWTTAAAEWQVSHIKAYPSLGPRRFGLAMEMLSDLKSARHKLIHLRGLWTFSSIAVNRAAHSGIPFIVSPEGMLDPWSLQQSPWKKSIAKWLFQMNTMRRAVALHALNVAELEHIRAFGLRNPVAIIPNGVDAPTELRPADRLESPRILLFLGRIHPKKGLAELIEAWALVVKMQPRLRYLWRIHIAGWDDGGHEPVLRRRISELGLKSEIRFVGNLRDEAKDKALRRASAFILPSHGEGLPISALEAAAYKLPLFLTTGCNLPEFIESNAAFKIESEPTRLAETLAVQLIQEYEVCEAVGEKAYKIAMRHFTWDSVVEKYILLYEWAIAGGRPPPWLEVR